MGFQVLEKAGKKVHVSGWFATGKRYATTGGDEEWLIFENLIENSRLGHFQPYPLQSSAWACLNAPKAQVTFLPIDKESIGAGKRLQRAGFDTCAAPDALALIKGQLHVGPHTFRIVAPQAGKRAAFKKDNASYARTVIQRIPFYLKNKRELHISYSCFPLLSPIIVNLIFHN